MAASCNLRSPLAMFVTFAAIVAGLAGTASADEKPDLLVLMHATGTIISLVQRGLGVGLVWDMGDLLQGEKVLMARFKKDLLRPTQLVAFW